MWAAGRTLSGERGVNHVSIHTDVCRGCGVIDMPGVLSPEHLGACAARVLILPIHLSSALSPRYFVGRSSRCGNTSPRGGNRAGVVFAGLRTSERSHGCRRASGRRLQQGPALRVTKIASPIFRYELVARAPVGCVVQAEFAEGLSLYERRTRRRKWTLSKSRTKHCCWQFRCTR